jgi:copper(I)-binding protein
VLLACATAASPSPTAERTGSLVVRDAWIRAGDAGGLSAAYLTIANGISTGDSLVGVSAPDLASAVSLHETTTDDDGMTGMHHTPSIRIPASGTVALEPGGFHVMLEGLQRDLIPGEAVTLMLRFERAGSVSVDARVRAG